MFEIKNIVYVFVFTFLKHNGLCGRLADSSYTEESISCTHFCVHVMPFTCTQFAKACSFLNLATLVFQPIQIFHLLHVNF